MKAVEKSPLNRRSFLAAPVMLFGWLWGAKPAEGFFWLRAAFSLVRVGFRVMRGARVVSRGSRAFSRGIGYSRAVSRPRYGRAPTSSTHYGGYGRVRTPGASTKSNSSGASSPTPRPLTASEKAKLKKSAALLKKIMKGAK